MRGGVSARRGGGPGRLLAPTRPPGGAASGRHGDGAWVGARNTKPQEEPAWPSGPPFAGKGPPLRRSGPTEPGSAISGQSVEQPAGSLEDPPGDPDPQPDRDTEPGIEDTDAADAIEVADLEAEVVVIDERPRYHLAGCAWVGERPTIALPLREARDLGFTPCAACTPGATLAARSRLARQQG